MIRGPFGSKTICQTLRIRLTDSSWMQIHVLHHLNTFGSKGFQFEHRPNLNSPAGLMSPAPNTRIT